MPDDSELWLPLAPGGRNSAVSGPHSGTGRPDDQGSDLDDQGSPAEDAQDSGGDDGELADQPDEGRPADHDKQGLELARSLAGRLKSRPNGGPTPPVRRRRRRSADPSSSGARPDDRDPQLLTSAIGRLLRDQGWEVDVAVHGVMARWPSIVGAEMAQHCVPESYTDTELVVRTDSTAWATQVRLLAPELVRRLNAVLGDGTVTRVSVQGPNAPSWRKGPRTVRGGRGPRDTYG